MEYNVYGKIILTVDIDTESLFEQGAIDKIKKELTDEYHLEEFKDFKFELHACLIED
jgi:hypothetical protein